MLSATCKYGIRAVIFIASKPERNANTGLKEISEPITAGLSKLNPYKKASSDFENIRVINSFEIGLSKSRNLAIKNALGDICIIADDDIEYVEDF